MEKLPPVGKEFIDGDDDEAQRHDHHDDYEAGVTGFDGMNVEDWLAKHHEMAERTRQQHAIGADMTQDKMYILPPPANDPTLQGGGTSTSPTQIIDHDDEQDHNGEDDDGTMVMNVEDWLVKRHDEASRSCTHHDVQAKRRRHDSAPPVIIRGKEGLVSRTRAIHHDHSSTTTPPDEDEDGNRNNSTDEGDVEILVPVFTL